MYLKVLSPEKTLVSCQVQAVDLPGAAGRFMVLENHAPIISSLTSGFVSWREKEGNQMQHIQINSGFVQVRDNEITVCAE